MSKDEVRTTATVEIIYYWYLDRSDPSETKRICESVLSVLLVVIILFFYCGIASSNPYQVQK